MSTLPAATEAEAESGAPLDPEELLAALPAQIFVVDEADRVRYANPAAEQFLGADQRRLRGRRIGDILGAANPLVELLARARLGRPVREHNLELTTGEGARATLDAAATPLAGRPGWLVVSVREHSALREMDRQLVGRDAARGTATMAAVLAHEVKNPLAGISGAAQLIEQRGEPRNGELARLIRAECDRICALIDRLELLGPQPPVARAAVNVHEVLGRARTLAQSSFAKDIRFEENYDPSLPPVFGDRDQLVQVVLNLVKNAAEASPDEGGVIRISTAYRTGMRLMDAGDGRRRPAPVEITIADNGPGIPASVRERLFAAFVTTKSRGSGLGLALVAKLVNDHEGTIECDSDAEGTAFRVRLPVAGDGARGVESGRARS